MREAHRDLFAEPRFGAALQRHLDEGRDPLDDRAITAWLLDHPDDLPEFARLRARLQSIWAAEPPAAVTSHPRQRRWRRAAVAAAVFLATTGALVWTGLRTAAAPRSGRLLSCTLSEQRPRTLAAVSFSVRQRLVETATTHLEVVESWSRCR